MTEAEWQTTTDPVPMLQAIDGRGSDRRLRLFAAGCGRHAGQAVELSDTDRRVLELAEEYADGLVSEVGREWLYAEYFTSPNTELTDCLARPGYSYPRDVAARAIGLVGAGGYGPGRFNPAVREAETAAQAGLLRDIFGNPFRPVSAEPSWLTSTVVALSEGIYQERAFDRLQILADALMDAGCDNADVLDHCRGDGPHVRGCWVVDLLTGRS